MQQDTQNYRRVFESIWRIEKAVLETVDFNEATKQVVNIILTELGYIKAGYEVIVLTLLDEQNKTLKRIAISNTESAQKFLNATPVPFNDIIIPLWATQNLSVRAISEKKRFVAENVSDILVPAIDREWVDSFQSALGIKSSLVYPIIAKDKVLGTLIFSLSKPESEIKEEEWEILDSFVGAVGIALDNALLFESVESSALQLKLANAKLQELDKLKDEFLSIASHELRTPMTIVKDYVSVILADQTLSQETREKLEKVLVSTQRLIAIVNDNLDIAKIESGQMKFNPISFDISKLAVTVKEELTPKYTVKNQKLEVQVGNYMVKADQDKIHQVLMNLMDNAVKYTPNDGLIEVSFQIIQNVLVTTISDNGIGIKPEEMSKLFMKFERLDNSSQISVTGTGLGLYLTKKIIEKSGGQIRAESPQGKGSKFIFTLPVS
jgi:signal transduction histidine kinase